MSLTFNNGTLPQATGDVQSAAWYATLPEAAGRWGWVDGKRCSEMCGDKISCGSGEASSDGRRFWSVLKALESQPLLHVVSFCVLPHFFQA